MNDFLDVFLGCALTCAPKYAFFSNSGSKIDIFLKINDKKWGYFIN